MWLSRIISYLAKVFIYRLTTGKQLPWLVVNYTVQQKNQVLAMLASLLDPVKSTHLEREMIQQIAKVIFSIEIDSNQINSITIADGIAQLPTEQHNDLLVLCVIVALCQTDLLPTRCQVLLSQLDHFHTTYNLKPILQLIINDDIKGLQKPSLLGQGYHNKISHILGIRDYGLVEYRKQMKLMKQHKAYPMLKNKYSFLNDLSRNTLGGAMREQLKQCQLKLPGEPGGFAEFFLWHEITHTLSGNGNNWIGELATNAFTAGYSHYYKFNILVWGLLQFNLGFSLAVVATPNKNALNSTKNMYRYLFCLLSGTRTNIDLLTMSKHRMFIDLSKNLPQLRAEYNIDAWDDKL